MQIGVYTLVVDTCSFPYVNHRLDILLAVLPVCQEDAGSAGHGQQIGIGCERVFRQRVLCSIVSALCIVVFNKSDGPLTIFPLFVIVGDKRPVTIVLLSQT